MNNPIQNNPKDYQVVEFFNSTDFDFTPELGAMYDSRPFFVKSGEKRQLPYHVGHRLAENLAKAVMIKGAPLHDPNANNPTGTPLWSTDRLTGIKNSFLTELYSEAKPVSMSETDKLMERVAQLEKMVTTGNKTTTVQEIVAPELTKADGPKMTNEQFRDKMEVIKQLEAKGIKVDRRKSKAELEKLLTA